MSGELNSDRKSTRLNSSHANISYAVFCLKKNKKKKKTSTPQLSNIQLALNHIPQCTTRHLRMRCLLAPHGSILRLVSIFFFFFFFNNPAPPEFSPLPLPAPLPISSVSGLRWLLPLSETSHPTRAAPIRAATV